jgi:uncharacterized DUF497 family protein
LLDGTAVTVAWDCTTVVVADRRRREPRVAAAALEEDAMAILQGVSVRVDRD